MWKYIKNPHKIWEGCLAEEKSSLITMKWDIKQCSIAETSLCPFFLYTASSIQSYFVQIISSLLFSSPVTDNHRDMNNQGKAFEYTFLFYSILATLTYTFPPRILESVLFKLLEINTKWADWILNIFTCRSLVTIL